MSALDLRGVGFTYRGAERPALSGIDLILEPGEMRAVLGPQGSGTSTLCRLAAGVSEGRGVQSGEVNAGGQTVMLGDDPEAQLSGMTSRVGDEVQLSSRLHGIAPGDAHDSAERALAALGVGALWDRHVDTLSGGQRQLVALAGLLALEPALLVLDQPGLSLDPHMREGLVTALSAFAAGGGAVLVTGHQFDEVAAGCEAVSFLVDGTIVETVGRPGPDVGVLAEHGVWSAFPRGRQDDSGLRSGGPAHSETALSIEGLRVARGGITVLDAVDLDLGAGEFVALMGPNGSGKSTLLRALLGLLEPSAEVEGTVRVRRLGEDIDLTPLPTHLRAAFLGWVGQDPGTQLTAATVGAELRTAAPLPVHRRRDRARICAERDAAAASALDATGLTALADSHPYDLGTARRKDVVLASALVTEPRILLLDEPTSGRDDGDMGRLTRFAEDFLERGGSVIAATHDEHWAHDAAHRIVRLDAGRLFAERDGR